MKNAKKNYCYLIRRKRDGKLFCTYGNFKEAWNRPKYLFNLVSSAYIYAVKLPFGNLLASNVSSDLIIQFKRLQCDQTGSNVT